jgi:ketosteroid isomerase-like protein
MESGSWEDRAMASQEDVVRLYVGATSEADGDAAAALAAEDLVIELPGGATLEGKEGASGFAAKHAELDGRKQSVTLASVERLSPNEFVLTLVMSSREVTTDELLYSMDVGSVIEIHNGLITRHRIFPSPEEAAAAAQSD